MKRTAERTLLFLAAAYDVILASVTFFLYAGYVRETGYTVFEQAGRLSSIGAVNNAVSVVNVYAGLLLAVGVASFVVALRGMRYCTISRGISVWLGVAFVFSLATGDLIGSLLYSVAGVLYLARNRAMRAKAGSQFHHSCDASPLKGTL